MKRLTECICLLMLLLTGCADKTAPTLRLGTNVWPGYEPLYLARQQGVLKKDKVHLIEFSSASQVIQAYRNHLIDAAALTLDEALLLLESGEKPKIVLVMDISNGGDAIIGQPDIATLADIKGKRVAVESDAVGAYVITRALDIANLNKQSIEIVSLDIDEHEKAFLQHTIDAVVTFEPVRSKLLKAGGHLLFDSQQLPDEIADVLVVRDEYLRQHPDSVQYLIDGWYKALAFMEEQPRVAAETLGLRMNLNVEETLATYTGLKLPDQKRNQQLLKSGSESELNSIATNLMLLMHRENLIKEKIDTAELFSNLDMQNK